MGSEICIRASLWRAPDSTRLVFDLSAPVEHKLFTFSGPSRVVIDIQDIGLPKNFDVPLQDTPIDKIRYARREGGSLRVVLDLKQQVKPRSFVLKKHGEKPDRLVVDLYSADKKNAQAAQQLSDVLPNSRDIIIAVDAGHGGEDPGSLGPKRIREKEVVLDIAGRLVKLINADRGNEAM